MENRKSIESNPPVETIPETLSAATEYNKRFGKEMGDADQATPNQE